MVTDFEILEAAQAIRSGELVAFPTETVYGLGAAAFDANSVAKIFQLKGRPRFDPFIVHVADADALSALVTKIPPLAQQLIDQFWPGPLSLVLPKQSAVPDIVTAGLPSVAVRCPSHDVARRLIQAAEVPIAAPSANRFGRVSPTTGRHVIDQFGSESPLVLDAGPCPVGVESTVVSFVEPDGNHPTLLRHGGVTFEELETVLGRVTTQTGPAERPSAPGQLTQHYSPATPLLLIENEQDSAAHDPTKRVGLLSFETPTDTTGFASVEVLSPTGCLREAAVNLFAAMRRLDALDLDWILARPVPETGLGRAIMDRLRRAAAR